jgi:hypothetical protein
VDWHPEKPTMAQVYFGICFLVALAVVPLYWSINEEDLGNRVFLLALGGLLLALAIWRVFVAVRLSRERVRR